jgi:hypothetical protein
LQRSAEARSAPQYPQQPAAAPLAPQHYAHAPGAAGYAQQPAAVPPAPQHYAHAPNQAAYANQAGVGPASPQHYPPAPGQPAYGNPGGPVHAAAPHYAPMPAAPAYANGPGAAKKGGALGKILLVLGAFFLLFMAVGVLGLIYVGIRAKRAVESAAEQHGIALGDFTSGEKGNLGAADPCSFLTASEAGQILKVSIVRTETQGNTCNYFAEKTQANAPALEQQVGELQKAEGNDAKKQELERLAKGFVGSAVDPSMPYLTIQYDENGKAHMAGMKIAAGTMGEFEKISGVGDEAMLGPLGSIFVFLYKGTAVQMDLRQITEGRARGIELGKKITSRM